MQFLLLKSLSIIQLKYFNRLELRKKKHFSIENKYWFTSVAPIIQSEYDDFTKENEHRKSITAQYKIPNPLKLGERNWNDFNFVIVVPAQFIFQHFSEISLRFEKCIESTFDHQTVLTFQK